MSQKHIPARKYFAVLHHEGLTSLEPSSCLGVPLETSHMGNIGRMENEMETTVI